MKLVSGTVGRYVVILSTPMLWLPARVVADAESVAKTVPPAVGSAGNLLNVVIGLGLILALILGLAWLMRRLGQGGFMHNSQMKIVAAMPLGTRERLLVVDVAGQQLLLGVTATQINTLHVFETPIIDANSSAQNSEFGRKLMAVLQKK